VPVTEIDRIAAAQPYIDALVTHDGVPPRRPSTPCPETK
jgi:hypothetical protein